MKDALAVITAGWHLFQAARRIAKDTSGRDALVTAKQVRRIATEERSRLTDWLQAEADRARHR